MGKAKLAIKPLPAVLMSLCINPSCPKPESPDNLLFCPTCGSELLLEGRYRATRKLGEGGFGKTYEVSDGAKRTAASGDRNTPKVLKLLTNNDAKYVELFQREAEVLSKLNHPGIPQVEPDGYFTVFPRNSTEPLHCLVMEYIEGMNLEEYLQQRQNRPINQKLALQWLAELVTILDVVHSHNFFHRDIKPSNIMLQPDGTLVLIDFGTAREITSTIIAGGQNTQAYTPDYGAPEQQKGHAVLQSDFFALGRTFVYLLTGKHPNQFYDPYTDECNWHPAANNVSSLLADFLDYLMARLPGERPANTQVILQELQQIEQKLYPAKVPLTVSSKLPTNALRLQRFEFDVAFFEKEKSGIFGINFTWKISRRRSQAEFFTEDLGSGVILEMVAIPGGTFLMGSPDSEEGRSSNESPHHSVTVTPFYMGKFTVTQAQWRVVVNLPQVNCALNPDPSYFKGKNLPVESITWNEAVEFCERLSQKTGRNYCLPSEAEWEYTCRAGTTTPFHFGETITTDLANYNGHNVYGSGSKGIYRQKTSPVSCFHPNAFGLYDMHGNVWEWCADHWHDNYNRAPSDRRVWANENNRGARIMRGGSWPNEPKYCRSASRFRSESTARMSRLGFRVVCTSA
ncbi:SUMF1/EgtB/PvdO family nonheme iron enzyme [Microcoleus sp. FACHB-53]|nr:SUMF1/EgtB/PvdO family nonheme iron enzyme [Microcoleus sp. FACHB-53]